MAGSRETADALVAKIKDQMALLAVPAGDTWRDQHNTVGGSALSLFLVTSWRFRGDTDTSWVATKSPKGPLRSADGRTKEAPCHTTTQPHCAFVCLPYLLVGLNFICHLMGGTKLADAIREARRIARSAV